MSLTPTRPSQREWHRSPSRQAVLPGGCAASPGRTVDRLKIPATTGTAGIARKQPNPEEEPVCARRRIVLEV